MANFYKFWEMLNENQNFTDQNIKQLYQKIYELHEKIDANHYEYTQIDKIISDLYEIKDKNNAENIEKYELLASEIYSLLKISEKLNEQSAKIINLLKNNF